MRVIRSEKPFHRVGFGTSWVASTASIASPSLSVGAIGLFVLATGCFAENDSSRGYGLGTYAYVYPVYATFDIGAPVVRAHNQWLEWAAEGGIPLARVWLTLAIAISVRAVRSIWGIGILAAFLHARVDYPFVRSGLTARTCCRPRLPAFVDLDMQ